MEPFPYSVDSRLLPSSLLFEYYTPIHQGLKNLGVDLQRSRDEAGNLESYGFTNTRQEIFKIPIGTWPDNQLLKTVGMYAKVGITEGLEAMAYGPLCRGMGWSKEKVEEMCADVRRYLSEEHRVKAYMKLHISWGQKPPDPIRMISS